MIGDKQSGAGVVRPCKRCGGTFLVDGGSNRAQRARRLCPDCAHEAAPARRRADLVDVVSRLAAGRW